MEKEIFLFVFRADVGVQSSVGAGPAQGRQQAPHPVKGEQKILDALSGLEEDILLNDLVSEDALVNVGLSSAHPQGKDSFYSCFVFCLLLFPDIYPFSLFLRSQTFQKW